ncbi:unnamed protein product [Sphenostylis stenocarpa]|uniref:Uncharacterized protein n=1 Tax=Sphenostylis stenocarpa TaxID=92480 RepID=A0AA86W152_9FABA|nr:unnamed protein product [Sphenostylis stenocarpa]
MAAILKSLAIFLVIARGAYGECTLRNLQVRQYGTGKSLKGYHEYSVSIFNKCNELCVQSNVKLNCSGFQTVEKVEPSILRVSGDVCDLNNALPITSDATVNFRYAWSNSFHFNPIFSDIHCYKS